MTIIPQVHENSQKSAGPAVQRQDAHSRKSCFFTWNKWRASWKATKGITEFMTMAARANLGR